MVVMMTVLWASEYAPRASKVVALRFSSWMMKLQMGCGCSHTMLKHLQRFIFSMTLSTTIDLATRPMTENRPVEGPYITNERPTAATSAAIRAEPMFMLVYFFKIMAMTSVPPEDAPMLNRIAEPIAGSIMANTSSSIGWSVRVPCIGTSASSACRLTDITMVA